MEGLRIKYVGFIADTTCYIVDLDNKEVLYKERQCTMYTKLTNRVVSFVNPINGAMTVSFATADRRFVAEVEVLPKCIEHCSVTLTSTETHEKELLSKDFVNFDYFDYNNLLDSKGNLLTYIDYNEVFGLTEEELSLIFTHEESINFIKRVVENIRGQYKFEEIIRGILTEIKSKITHEVEPLK